MWKTFERFIFFDVIDDPSQRVVCNNEREIMRRIATIEASTLPPRQMAQIVYPSNL
jgi:hypothetical protein